MFLLVYARANVSYPISLFGAIGMEAFVTIHMTFFVLKPLFNLISEEDSKSVFWRLFFIRIMILLLLDLMGFTFIAIVDFL